MRRSPDLKMKKSYFEITGLWDKKHLLFIYEIPLSTECKIIVQENGLTEEELVVLKSSLACCQLLLLQPGSIPIMEKLLQLSILLFSNMPARRKAFQMTSRNICNK